MADRIVIFGAGGLGREVLQTIRDQQRAGRRTECLGFVVDPEFGGPDAINCSPVHRDFRRFAADPAVHFIVAVGDPAARARIAERIARLAGPRFAVVVHPSSTVGDNVTVGEGSIVLAGACITTDVRIGRHVLVNPQVSISHDCVVEDFVSLAPAVALAGGVRLDEGCELGIGASVIPRQHIGRWSMVGAGAVVIRPVAPHTTVIGVPARPIEAASPTGNGSHIRT